MKRKLISSLIAATMVLSLSAPAYAVEGVPDNTVASYTDVDDVRYITVQIKKLDAVQHYNAYKILDVVPNEQVSGEGPTAVTSKMYAYSVVKTAEGKVDANVAQAINDVAAARNWSTSTGYTLEALYKSYTDKGSQNSADYDRAVYDFISGTGDDLLKDANVPGEYRDKDDPSEWVSSNDALKLARELEAALRSHSVEATEFTVNAKTEEEKESGNDVYQSYVGKEGLIQGYYLFSQSDEDDTSGTTRSLFMLNTASYIDGILKINPKVGTPTVDKTIRVPDSTTDKIDTTNDHDSVKDGFSEAGVAAGSTEVEFKIVCTLPENIEQYEENDYFPFIIHDTMVGADIKEIEGVADFEVWIDPDGPVRRDNAEDPDEITGGTAEPFSTAVRNYAAPTDEESSYAGFQYWGENNENTNCHEGKHNVHFGVGNLFDIMKENSAKLTKDGTITFYYRAIVNGENAVIGGNGNPNAALVEYGNNPYWKGEPEDKKDPKDPKPTTEETNPNYAVFFTFRSQVDKIDGEKNPLKGAEFEIQKLTKDKTTGGYKWVSKKSFDTANATKDQKGDYVWNSDVTSFNFKTLNDGIYRFKETKVPDGYNAAADVYFSVSKGVPDIVVKDSEGNEVDPSWDKVKEEDLLTLTVNKLTFTSLNINENYQENDDGTLAGVPVLDWNDPSSCFTKVYEDVAGDSSTEHRFDVVYSTASTGGVDDGSGTTKIVNLPGNLLPSTGGVGTTMMYIGGSAALLAALGAAFVLKKKKENEAA